ncbi:hypothetical protein FN976_07775 [Caenimonas sedimenti]|uniref:Uncharacterized protein n=1 Tax=Caenimonas sedimenti TaxID=2596921 RepID=A0A562ZTE8_9BURK|nr:hypothetical protein FN976_07775 [Caenimonas sedimenti]
MTQQPAASHCAGTEGRPTAIGGWGGAGGGAARWWAGGWITGGETDSGGCVARAGRAGASALPRQARAASWRRISVAPRSPAPRAASRACRASAQAEDFNGSGDGCAGESAAPAARALHRTRQIGVRIPSLGPCPTVRASGPA